MVQTAMSLSVLNSYEQFLTKIDSENKESIVLGDFNCDLQTDSPSHFTANLQFISEAYQYEQLITECTRITETTR
jgi:exonuclease III